MEFFTEFLPQIWPLFLFVIVSIVLLVVLMAVLRGQRKKQRELAKEKVMGFEPATQKKSSQKGLVDEFDDDQYDDDDDPLALLSMARREAQADLPDEALNALLATMGEAPLHTIAVDPITVKLSNGNQTEARELLSVMRDEADGRLMIQIGETAFRSLVADANAKAEFTRIMKELSGIILKPDDAPAPEASPVSAVVAPPVPAKPVPTPPVAKPVAPEKPAPAPESVTDEATKEEVAKNIEAAKKLADRLPGDLPDMRLSDNPDNYKKDRFGRISIARVDKAPEINIAEAIESYLQYKIERAPEFQKRGIHIRPAISGGIRIEADGKNYDFVDEVEDPVIRKLLQDSIAEWQERH